MSESTQPLLIAVMGATGAGKSTFINLASGSHLKVGYGLESCTSDVEVSTSLVLNNRLVTLIDTPGFDDTVKSEAEILRLIADFLAATYEGGKKLNGIIFVHRISDYRMGGVARKNFRLFRKLCGDDALKNVVIVTNMWGDVSEEIGAAREKELSENELFFKPALEKGAAIMRHDNTAESARRIVQSFVGFEPEVLTIQREVVDEKKAVAQTAAGQDLTAELEKQLERHKKDMETIRQEMADLLAEKDKAHQEEIQELTDALSEVKSQLAKYELERQSLNEERTADREAAECKAKQLIAEMEDREVMLEALREQAREQAEKISGLHGALASIEQRAREQELQRKETDDLLRAQQEAHQAELDRVRQDFERKLEQAAARTEKAPAQAPAPPKAPWDIVRDYAATISTQPAPRRGGFFRELAFAVDALFGPRTR